MERVLTVDDDPAVLELVRELLTGAGLEVDQATSCAEAIRHVREGFRGVVVLDMRLPDGRGSDILPDLARYAPENPVVFLTGYGSTSMALESIQGGAFDFLDKTRLVEKLVPTVLGAMQSFRDATPASVDTSFDEIVTRSASMRAMFRSLRHALESRVPVLIRGESGTGKELVARALHRGSPRRNGPFVAVNCAGIPDTLLEAELFGYERGAFTGAVGRKPGRFDLAQRGTLLLDEIGEMELSLQAKLLRVLQEGEYQRLGGVETLKSDVRLVSATNRNLEQEVARGRFREDLYYRLAVFTVELPPLRERPGDIPLLAEHFVAKACAAEGKPSLRLDRMALDVLEDYSFPGNVRQLENVLAHAVVSCTGSAIRLADLPQAFLRSVALERDRAAAEPPPPRRASLPPSADPVEAAAFPTLASMERDHIERALHVTGGNKAEAARILGISRMTLYRKLEER